MTNTHAVMESNTPVLKFSTNSVTIYNKGTEMIKIENEGFYVRGVKIPIDETESSSVYKAFREFLIIQILTSK